MLLPGEQIQVGFEGDTGSEGGGRFIALRAQPASAAAAPTRGSTTRTLPARFALGQNEPNPFGSGTLIRFELPARSTVSLEVFDIRGRRIKTLTRGEWQAGFHALEWNGRDTAGRRVGPGVYLYRMKAGAFAASRKLVVMP